MTWEKIEIDTELEQGEPIILLYLGDFGLRSMTVTFGSLPMSATTVAKISTGEKYISSTSQRACTWLIDHGCTSNVVASLLLEDKRVNE